MKTILLNVFVLVASTAAMASNDRLEPETGPDIFLRLRGGWGSLSKVSPLKTGPIGAVDIDFSPIENVLVGGTISYLMASKTVRTSTTDFSARTETKLDAMLFGLTPKYQISRGRTHAYAGAFLGWVALSSEVGATTFTGTSPPVNTSTNALAYGPVVGLDISIAGPFGVGLSTAYVESDKIGMMLLTGGFTFAL